MNLRTNVILLAFGIIFLLMVYKLYVLQIRGHEDFAILADRQYISNSNTLLHRGNIYFSDKSGVRIPAATLSENYKVAFNPMHLDKNRERVFSVINTLVKLDRVEFFAKANKQNDPYEELSISLTKEQADILSSYKIGGLQIIRERRRFYPAGDLAAQTLGFVGYNKNNKEGIYGLEKYFNDKLDKDSSSALVNPFSQLFSDVKSVIDAKNMLSSDVETTIEPTVARMLQKELMTVKEKWGADEAGGIVIDPNTGEILALDSVPSFDPNNFSNVSKASVYSNPLVEHVFEMGSIIKPIMMSIAFNEGVVTPTTTYDDKGFVNVRDRTIRNFDRLGRGPGTTMERVLIESLNTGMYFATSKVSKPKMRDYLHEFGLYDKTNIELPYEASSIMKNLDKNNDVAFANASFGQGIALSPMVTVKALSVIANGGYVVNPTLIKKTDLDSVIPLQSHVVKKETTEEMTKILTKIVSKSLVQYVEPPAGYDIAAKTGTAQIPDPRTGGYMTDRNLHSFFGYFPAEKPRFLIFMYLKRPANVKYSSQTLSLPFMNMVKFLISYYSIPPKVVEEGEEAAVKNQ